MAVYTIYDGATPMLSAIAQVNTQVAYEVMSKTGAKTQKIARQAMRKQRHHWLQHGRMKPYYSKDKTKELGQRQKPDGSIDTPDSMSAMITSFLMEKSGTLVVGGSHKGFTPNKRENGKIVGKMNYVKGVGKRNHSILYKLDKGKRNEYHGWYDKKGVWNKDSMEGFKNAHYKAYNFMEKGIRAGRMYMTSEATREYAKIMYKAMANIKPVVKVRDENIRAR